MTSLAASVLPIGISVPLLLSMSGANVQIAPPNIANPESAITARRTPNMSRASPTGTCINAKLQWKTPLNKARAAGPACNSSAIPLTVMDGIVRNA